MVDDVLAKCPTEAVSVYGALGSMFAVMCAIDMWPINPGRFGSATLGLGRVTFEYRGRALKPICII